MIRQFLVISFLAALPFAAHAQLLENTNGDIWGVNPQFNEDYIREHKIKSISGDVTGKKVMHAIADHGHGELYKFYRNGKIQMYYKTLDIESRIDTVVAFYKYDNWGRYKMIRRNDGDGFYSHNYCYNPDDYISHINFHREYNQSKSKIYFLMGGSEELYAERYEYDKRGNTIIKRFFNTAGKEYKKETKLHNHDGSIKSLTTHFNVSDRETKEEYLYDSNGLMTQRKVLNNWSTQTEMLYKFEYDDGGNIELEDYYRGGVHQTHTEYLYRDGELYAKLVKDMESGFIRIVKYTFEYYREMR